MSKRTAARWAVFLLLAAFLFGPVQRVAATTYTKLFSVWIQGSLIDSTAIGSTTPSTGAFTTASASGGFAGNLSGNVIGNVTGNLTGNAGTASALAATPTPCTSPAVAGGITAAGACIPQTFTQSLATTGYATLPGGLIEEWGETSSSSTGDVPFTFPLTFPHAVFQLVVGSDSSGTGGANNRNNCYRSTPLTTSGTQLSTGGSTNYCSWFAVGY